MNNKILWTIIGILVPFIATTLGSGVVFFFKKEISPKLQKIFNGFAAGVMFAASIWSLIIPAIDMGSEQGKIGWIPATIGIIFGTAFLLFTDSIFEKSMNKNSLNGKIKKNKMLGFAITLHNIPEGMAVRNCFCFKLSRKLWSWNYVCTFFSNRNCNTKFSRRNGNISSI